MIQPGPAVAIMFHDVIEDADWESSGFPGGANARYKLGRAQFEDHLDAICLSTSAERRARVALTFDDGGVSAHNTIADCLEQRGLRGYFLITTDCIGRTGFLNAAQIRDLHRRGHVLGSHSCSHPTRISQCSRQEIDYEWIQSIHVLTELLGEEVSVASVPGGFYSREVAESAAAAGIHRLFTSEPVAKVRVVNSCEVFGRYHIQRNVPPEFSAGIAALRIAPRFRQAMLWKLKKLAKAAGGATYIKLRRRLLNA
jgi:peptidoglycan/xylan/chitin deacetylase (PgdA/CDA1 family)